MDHLSPLFRDIFHDSKIAKGFSAATGTDAGTAAKIFEAMDDALKSRDIPWGNCIGLSVDNTSVNMGRHNSIRSRVLQKNSSMYVMGCPCHIVHNTAQKAGNAFCEVTDF